LCADRIIETVPDRNTMGRDKVAPFIERAPLGSLSPAGRALVYYAPSR